MNIYPGFIASSGSEMPMSEGFPWKQRQANMRGCSTGEVIAHERMAAQGWHKWGGNGVCGESLI